MGIQVEFNPDLALRDYKEFLKGARKEEECIPERLISGKIYSFLKKGYRLYWLSDSEFWSRGEMPLCKTEGNENLSRPVASIKMLELTHFLLGGEVYTKGKYQVINVFDEKDPTIHFEGMKRV
jgi:hypothetical protein